MKKYRELQMQRTEHEPWELYKSKASKSWFSVRDRNHTEGDLGSSQMEEHGNETQSSTGNVLLTGLRNKTGREQLEAQGLAFCEVKG